MQPNNAEELVRDALRLLPWMLGYEEMEGCMIDWIEEQNEESGNDKFVQQMLHLLSEGKIRPSKPHSRLPKLAEPFISERDQTALQTHWMQQSHQSVSSMCTISCSELKHELADLVQRWLAQSALSTEAVAGALVSIMDDSISEPLFLRSSQMGGTPDIASSAANLQLFNKVKQRLVGFPLPSNLRRFVWKQALLKDPLLRSRLADDLKRALADERSPRLPAAGGAAQRHALESTSQQKVEHVLSCLKLLSINVTTRHTSIAAILCKVFDASEPAIVVEDLLAMLLQLTDVFLPSPLFRQAYNTMALASEAHQFLRATAPEVADKLEATCARILEVQPSRRQQPTFMLMFNRWLEDAWVGYMPEELLLFLWDQCFLLEWPVMLPRLCAFLVIAMEKTSGGDHWENVPSHRPQQLVDYTLANSSAMMQEIRTLLRQSKSKM